MPDTLNPSWIFNCSKIYWENNLWTIMKKWTPEERLKKVRSPYKINETEDYFKDLLKVIID